MTNMSKCKIIQSLVGKKETLIINLLLYREPV